MTLHVVLPCKISPTVKKAVDCWDQRQQQTFCSVRCQKSAVLGSDEAKLNTMSSVWKVPLGLQLCNSLMMVWEECFEWITNAINLLNWAWWFGNEIFRSASLLWRGSRKHWLSICFPWLPCSVSCKLWVICAALSLPSCSCITAVEEDNLALCSAPYFLPRL